MRIVSGTFKGRKIKPPRNLPVRPTTDFAKEALFNILNNHYHFPLLDVLDLFSGTGNIAFEFASRGAKSIIAVDEYYPCIKFIDQTAQALEMPISAVKSDGFKFLETLKQSADIIFADPPYKMEVDELEKLVNTVFQRDLLKEKGRLIIEHSKQLDLSQIEHFSGIRRYGKSVFSFFSHPQ